MLIDSTGSDWVVKPVSNMVKYVADETLNASVLHKCIINTQSMSSLLGLMKKCAKLLGHDFNHFDGLQKENEFLSEKADDFIRNNFHTINSHGLIGLWCSVETAIEDTIVLILMNDNDAIQTVKDAGYKIKNSLHSPVNENDARTIFRVLERQVRQHHPNVGKTYCVMLSIFGLTHEIEEKTLDVMAEINAVRNSIIHRGGVINEKDARDSPSLELFVSKEVNINNDLYLKYYDAIGEFAHFFLGAAMTSSYFQ